MSQQNDLRDEEIISMLRQCEAEYDVCTPRRFSKMDGACPPSLVIRRFGSWKKAKEVAGVGSGDELDSSQSELYTDEDILWEINACARRNDGDCTVDILEQEEDLIEPSVAIERFGSWFEAKRLAGVGDNLGQYPKKEYSDEDYLRLVEACSEKHGEVVRMTDG